MGRKLEFSREKALNTAMESFWAQGYDATSMRELASRLGLHLGSVYNALGDKEKVFEAALRLNIEEHVMPHMKALAEDRNPLMAIDRHLDKVVEECSKPEGSNGCFVINSLLEINRINESITEALHGYMAQVEQCFAACIRNARELGQIPADRDPKKYAHSLMATCFAMRAMAKLGAPKEVLKDVRDCAYHALIA